MAKLFVLPGVERRDLTGTPIPSAEMLQAAINNGVTDVIVVGRSRNGELYVAGPPDVDKTVGMLMRAVTMLAGMDVVHNAPIEIVENETP